MGVRAFKASLVVLLLASPAVRGGLLSNPSFEDPAGTTNWAGTGWASSGSAWRRLEAAWTGSRGAWVDASAAGEARFFQDAPAPTGTYTFSGWLKIDPGCNPTNLQLRLEWKDSSTNDVQPASVANLTGLPRDAIWHHVHVTGACDGGGLSFVRAIFESQYTNRTSGPSTILFDEADLYSGPYAGVQYMANGSFERGDADASE